MVTQPVSRPNIVLFICDDLAWGDLACHGNPHIRTPNLDRIHRQSARLEHHCSGPLCSPARASLLTGRYHLRTRVIDTYCGRSIIDPEERTLAQALADDGYRCGAFGKWHLGDCYPSRACDLGFHETVVHLAGGIGQPGDYPENNTRWQVDSYFDPILSHNGGPKAYAGYCTDIFATEAIRFIDENKDHPFFAYVATNAPHSPLLVEDRWARPHLDRGVDPIHAKVYGMVENIDHNAGRILDHLETTGLADNTIFIFTSDHGPCGSADSTNDEIRWNAGLRDRKGTLYQGGVKVPFLLRYPARALRQEAIRRVTSPIDVMPTLLDFCGTRSPEIAPKMDGLSLRGLLEPGSTTPVPPEGRQIFMQWHRGDVPIPRRNCAVIGDRYKFYSRQEDAPAELYDLINDPSEEHDITGEQPGRAAALGADYDAWLHDMAGTRGVGSFDSQPIHIGSEAAPTTLLTTNDWRLVTGEGWDTTDLRGYWRVKNLTSTAYHLRIRFKDTMCEGPFFLSIDDVTLTTDTVDPDGWVDFPKQTLNRGFLRLEGWTESRESDDALYLKRFQAAFYLEISQVR